MTVRRKYRDGAPRQLAKNVDLASLLVDATSDEERAATLLTRARETLDQAIATQRSCSANPALGVDPLVASDVAQLAARLFAEWANILEHIALESDAA